MLSPTLRQYVGMANRVTKEIQRYYLRLFEGNTQQALRNNYNAQQIACGFDMSIHFQNLMSGLGPQLTNRLVRKIVGTVYVEGPNGTENPIEEKLSNAYLSNVLKQAFSFSVTTGRSALVLDFVDGKATVRVIDQFRFKQYKVNGELKQVEMFLIANQSKGFEAYNIVERRYFNSKGIPCQKYIVTKTNWESESDLKASTKEYLDAKQIPAKILEEYKHIPFNREIELTGYTDLGVYVISNSAYCGLYPYNDVADSQFIYIQDRLAELDSSITAKEIDKHLGRGRVLKPEHNKGYAPQLGGLPMNAANMIGMPMASGSGDVIFTPYPSLSLDQQQPISIQFNLRTAEWREEINGVTADICAAFGLSILDYDPRLLVTGQRTDDEINALTDITRATVEEKRELATESINAMLKQIANLYGIANPLFIRWSLSSILNPTKNTALVRQQLEMGVISQREAIKRLNPDYTNAEIDELLADIQKEQEQARQATAINNAFEEF